ncbi:unnamed protein product [Brachionus calyciflorus]|uniref:MULE transposase domain-containing protein n=1 Tax=Brachionus calyciflorus TaxID=104777 RepID=A0A814CA85_9BILA|nr:unnamed protein product [Brachionus calyciflorus]
MYKEFLIQIKQKLNCNPLSITSDFEKAFINASSSVFTGVKVFGCFFHLKQSMWRKITDLGLKTIYNDDEKVREILKLPQSLAFIPKEDVKLAISLINSDITDPTIIDFYNYVEDVDGVKKLPCLKNLCFRLIYGM